MKTSVIKALSTRPATSWLDSSLGKALYGYHNNNNKRSWVQIFQPLISQLLKLCL